MTAPAAHPPPPRQYTGSMVKVAVLASFNMDLVMRAERLPASGETLQGSFAMFLGGKGCNQAVAARRLGASVAVIGRVGADDFGRAFLEALDREGIDRTRVTVDRALGTGVASVTIAPDGENAILQAPRANRAVTADVVAAAASALDGARIALLQLETSLDGALAFAREARRRGIPTLCNPAPALPAVPDELLRLADVLVPNELEARALTGSSSDGIAGAQVMADALRARGAAAVVITLGARGAIAVAEGVRCHVPAYAVRAIDTVGAGDAFCAALAVRLAERATLPDAVRFACAAGALAVTRPGAEPSMPRRADVEALAGTEVPA